LIYRRRRRHRKVRKTLRRIGNALILVPLFVTGALVLASLWIWVGLTWESAEGRWEGEVRAFASSGWLCTTWEGEVATAAESGGTSGRAFFTVRDQLLIGEIGELVGKRVVLTYRQHRLMPTSCFGDSDYFVTAVREVKPPTDAPPVVPAIDEAMPAPALDDASPAQR
jgi:hypothetical protein